MFIKNEYTPAKLCPFSFGVALGLTEGLFLLLFAWAGHFWYFGVSIIHQIATIYYGYAPTLMGGFYGALWGFLDGFVFGFILALIYDLCLGCCCAKTAKGDLKEIK